MARGEAEFNAAALARDLIPLSDLDPENFTPPRELAAYRKFYGFTSEVDHYIASLDTAQHWLTVQMLVPAHPVRTVVLCHGYYDHVGLYVYLIEHLLSKNIAVLTFDLPGHGLSSGERVTIDNFDQYVYSLNFVLESTDTQFGKWLPRPFDLVGQSLGGCVAMEYVESYGRGRFENVVLLAPLVRPYAWSVNRFVFQLARLFIKERPRTITNNADNAEFIKLQHADPLQAHVLPVAWVAALVRWMQKFEEREGDPEFCPLIVQGESDRTVDWRYNVKLLESRYSPKVLWLPEGRHHLVNESPGLRQQMFAWLDEECQWSS